jgi:hypothetical protein
VSHGEERARRHDVLHRLGAPFRREYTPQPLKPYEGPFLDPTQRLPQYPEVAAERREAARRYRRRKEIREREAAELAAEAQQHTVHTASTI